MPVEGYEGYFLPGRFQDFGILRGYFWRPRARFLPFGWNPLVGIVRDIFLDFFSEIGGSKSFVYLRNHDIGGFTVEGGADSRQASEKEKDYPRILGVQETTRWGGGRHSEGAYVFAENPVLSVRSWGIWGRGTKFCRDVPEFPWRCSKSTVRKIDQKRLVLEIAVIFRLLGDSRGK